MSSLEQQIAAHERFVREDVLNVLGELSTEELGRAGIDRVGGATLVGVFPNTQLVVSVQWKARGVTEEHYRVWDPPYAEPPDEPSAYLSPQVQSKLIIDGIMGVL